MTKLKLNKVRLETLLNYSSFTCLHIESEIEKFMFHKKSLEFLQLKVQLAEMYILQRKLQSLDLKKREVLKTKFFSFTLSPIQSLLFITYCDMFIKGYNNEYSTHILNEQKDIIYKELLTQ